MNFNFDFGRTYAQLLVDPDITQLNNNLTPLQYNQTKGLVGRPSDKIAWALTLLGHSDVLKHAMKAFMNKSGKTPPQPNRPPKTRKDPTSTHSPKSTPDNQNKGKENMPPMTRPTPNPRKHMRQKQSADAKLLATQNRQRVRALKE